jgi:hypothetical protein
MTLPSFNAEQSLYRSSRHYRSSAFASVVRGIRPSDDLPWGSYQDSCFNCTYNEYHDDNLICACYSEDGCVDLSVLLGISSTCKGCDDIYNTDGNLGCC